jgi:BASS family bile acid:Na+ symporter
MSIVAQLIPLVLNVSMGIVVLSLALHTTLDDALYLVRRPSLLVRSVVAMHVIMPAAALLLVLIFPLHPAIEIAIVALALSPVPPILPSSQTKAAGTAAYIVSLLAIVAGLSIIIVPLGTWIASAVLQAGASVPAAAILQAVLLTVILPLAVGLAVRHFAPDLAQRLVKPAAITGYVLLLIAVVPILFVVWNPILSMIGDGTLIVLAAFTIIGVAAGHLLGGPDPDDRSVLGLATGTRHPGVALAIAGTMFPEAHMVIAVVLLHLVVGALVSGPYVKWRHREHAAHERMV